MDLKWDERYLNNISMGDRLSLDTYFNRNALNYRVSRSECSKESPHSVKFMSCDFDKLSSPQRKAIEGLLKEYNNYNSPHLIDSILGTDDPQSRADKQAAILDSIQNIMGLSNNKSFQTYINVRNRVVEPINGALQFWGGIGETAVGGSVATGSSWTGIGIPIGIGGTYLVADGISNITGGISRFKNGIMGSTDGDEWNFMKNGYKRLFPTHGETIYNLTQIGIGIYTIGKGLSDIPDKAVKVYPRPKHIKKAQTKGLPTETIIVELKNKVIITTQEVNAKMATPMILQRTVIDKTKLFSKEHH